MRKVKHKEFPLAGQSGRVAILLGVLDGSVKEAEIKHYVSRDVEKRPFRKPVVANGVRYESVTAAARAIAKSNELNAVEAERKRIAQLCNEDCWVGYYWSN